MKKVYRSLLLVLAVFLLVVSCATEKGVATDKGIYKIGDTGPGRGTIFFAENGKYLECSVRLGREDWNDAQKIVNKHRGGKKKDWRLPAVEELDLIYNNLKLQNLGGLSIGRYWSSAQDESDNEYALVVNFLEGEHERVKTNFYCEIRGVRYFEN